MTVLRYCTTDSAAGIGVRNFEGARAEAVGPLLMAVHDFLSVLSGGKIDMHVVLPLVIYRHPVLAEFPWPDISHENGGNSE